MMFLIVMNLLYFSACGHILEAVPMARRRQTLGDDRRRIPTNVWMEAEENAITVHWTLPVNLDGVRFCIVAYQAKTYPVRIRIPVPMDQVMFTIDGLNNNTLYEIKLYCVYGSDLEPGPSTGWLRVATRTGVIEFMTRHPIYYLDTAHVLFPFRNSGHVLPSKYRKLLCQGLLCHMALDRVFQKNCQTVSADMEVCPGKLLHAVLSPECLEYPQYQFCEATCQDGYRKSDVPDVIRGYRNHVRKPRPLYLVCVNGTWLTLYEHLGFRVNDICLPVGEWEKCPLTIPNGALEFYCGPATDWLCEFSCDEGYHRHGYMSGILKNFIDGSNTYMLHCDNGVWKTGFEDLGVDISGVCESEEHNCTDSDEIPHGRVTHLPCPSGKVCGFECDHGFHHHALAWGDPHCENGHWGLRTTKYDPSVTAQTVCVPDDARGVCPKIIPNGHIADPDCTANCWPDCDEGYYVPGENGPGRLSCEGGKWLTSQAPYNGDNICFPEGGHLCPAEIPNGIVGKNKYWRRDDGTSRVSATYKCNDGLRPHHSIPFIECIAGKWVTFQERFGFNLSSLCISY